MWMGTLGLKQFLFDTLGGLPPLRPPASFGLQMITDLFFVYYLNFVWFLALIVILENGGKLKSLVMPTVPRPEIIRNLIR